MWVKGTCRSANRGGCPSFMPFQYSTGIYFVPAFILSGRQFSAYRGKFSAKQGKSEFFFGVLWCFLGIFGDQKGQNLRYIWVLRVQGLPLWLSLWGGGGVHLVEVVRSCSLSLGVFRPFALPLSLCCFCSPASALKYALFRVLRGFLEGFMVRMYVCMGLVLCVDCVAFVRVWS